MDEHVVAFSLYEHVVAFSLHESMDAALSDIKLPLVY
jgi:hypothetical protein